MPRGLKVFDVWGELHLDREDARQALRGVPAALGPDADRAGQELGKKMTDGLAKAVEASSARMAKARRAEVDASNAVTLAEKRLLEARQKGLTEGSARALQLTQALEKAQYRLSQAQSNTVSSTKKLEDAQRLLGRSMDDVGKSIGPRAQKAGDDAGGKLALGFRMSVIRNSPLIVAAAAGVLAAGAPVLTAGAVGLFAGIGIVAAAQSEKVGHAWSTTWGEISSSTIKSAAVIEPVLIRVADKVGDSFQRMAPRIENAFDASAPQIEVFADGILDLAENALPGLERAVERGMPVTRGLADFLGKTGTGISDFFDRISAHGPAAGQVFSELGNIMGELLPMLGELLGQGAELAADVLPAVTGVLGILNGVLDHTAFLLPTVSTALLGMKVANLVSGGIDSLATRLGTAAERGGAMAGIAGRVSGGLSGIAGAAGPAAAGVAFAVVAIQKWNELAEKSEDLNLRLGQAIHVGGSQAQAASKYYDNWAGSLTPALNNLPRFITDLSFMGHSIGDMIPDVEQSKTAFDTWFDSLGAAGQASEEVKLRTQDLDLQMKLYGEGSPQVEAAARALTDAQRAQAQVEGDLQMATEGVTDAMLAQADAAMGLANADLAHRNAVDAAEDSLAAYDEAVAKYGASSEEASDAARNWESDLSRVVATAGQLASDALPANMDANSKLALSQIAQRDALRELATQYGDKLPPALQQALASLEATTAGYDLAALEAERVAAATGTATEKMQKLGNTEAVPKIKAESSIFEGAFAATGEKMKQLDGSVATPKAKLDASVFAGTHAQTMGQIGQLAGQTPTPSAWLNSGPFSGTWGAVMGWIGQLAGQRPTPSAYLNDFASGGLDKISAKLAGIKDKTVTVTTVEKSVKAKAGGGPVDSPIFAAIGRKVQGPGGPTDDLVRAVGPGGADYRLSAGEFINNAMTVSQQGDAAFAALNAGRADIVLRRPPAPRSFAGDSNERTVERQLVSQQAGGATIHIGSVSLVVPGAFNLGSGSDKQRLIEEISEGLVALGRRRS